MNYHHRYIKDGSYEIICTRCFLTVGLATGPSAARALESQHLCPKSDSASAVLDTPSRQSGLIRPGLSAARSLRFVATARETHFALLSLTVIFMFYALPTWMEFVATSYFGPWVGTIFVGDLCGCLCLASVFNLRRTSIILYLALTTCEGVLFASRLLPASALLWITDLVPTMVVMAKIVSLRSPRPPQYAGGGPTF